MARRARSAVVRPQAVQWFYQSNCAKMLKLLIAFLFGIILTILVLTSRLMESHADLNVYEKRVEQLRHKVTGVREEERVGQRTLQDVIAVEKELMCAQEWYAIIKLRTAREQNVLSAMRNFFTLPIREKEERTHLVENSVRVFEIDLKAVQDRLEVGEVTRTDVAAATAAHADISIYLDTIKRSYAVRQPPICY